MVTFNVDSLDFVDDEEVRTGDAQEFASRYSSSNDRLEIEDLTAGTVAHVPRGTSTDLVGGKFAETVSEGKALADDGNVYDTIQGAVDNASSWVKVGPGTFNETFTISTSDFKLKGSGERTRINCITDGIFGIEVNASNVKISNLSITGSSNVRLLHIVSTSNNITLQNISFDDASWGVDTDESSNVVISNCVSKNMGGDGFNSGSGNNIIYTNNTIKNVGSQGIRLEASDSIITNNNIVSTTEQGLIVDTTDSTVFGNVIKNSSDSGLELRESGNIAVNNRLISTNGITDSTTGSVVQDNLVTQ